MFPLRREECENRDVLSYINGCRYMLCTLFPAHSLIPRPVQKIGENKVHVKLCKGVSNDDLYHVAMNYDVHISAYM